MVKPLVEHVLVTLACELNVEEAKRLLGRSVVDGEERLLADASSTNVSKSL